MLVKHGQRKRSSKNSIEAEKLAKAQKVEPLDAVVKEIEQQKIKKVDEPAQIIETVSEPATEVKPKRGRKKKKGIMLELGEGDEPVVIKTIEPVPTPAAPPTVEALVKTNEPTMKKLDDGNLNVVYSQSLLGSVVSCNTGDSLSDSLRFWSAVVDKPEDFFRQNQVRNFVTYNFKVFTLFRFFHGQPATSFLCRSICSTAYLPILFVKQ